MAEPRIDEHSETWCAVKAWAEARLRMHQRSLETQGLDMVQTEGARGAIRDLRLLLKLTEQPTRPAPQQ